MSALECWIRESCNARPGDKSLKAPSHILFKDWNAYAWAIRAWPMTHAAFARELERLGFTYVRRKGMRTWHGIALRKEARARPGATPHKAQIERC